MGVVYLLTPTSNHNWHACWLFSFRLYIFWLLHQTTTHSFQQWTHRCCISFDSYIKPQRSAALLPRPRVVYLLTPTSNHNWMPARTYRQTLYIFWLLHQTTTVLITDGTTPTLYIFWLLHQTTTYIVVFPESETLYIFWLLHQTTTWSMPYKFLLSLYIFWLLH